MIRPLINPLIIAATTTNERVKTNKLEGLMESMLSNVVPIMDTITDKMDSLITKEINNSVIIRSLEVEGMLPSNIEVNLKKEGRIKCKAIVTRSEIVVGGEEEKKEEKNMNGEIEKKKEREVVVKSKEGNNHRERVYTPPFPFPQRLYKQKIDKKIL